MKHKEEYCTCDRCGKIIDKTPRKTMYENIMYKLLGKDATRIIETSVDKFGYIADFDLIAKDVPAISIVESYNSKNREYDLCGNCRKDFERFMRNEP